jgi:SNF2 family DNA or RNA helicase
MKSVFAEMSEDNRWIEIYFRYDPILVNAMHGCRALFVPADKGGPLWKLPLTFDDAKLLTMTVGRENIKLGEALAEWGRREKAYIETIVDIISAKDGDLERLPDLLPKLHKTLKPFQRIGVQYAAFVDHPMIADDPGLGKTLQAIGAIFEGGTEEGPTLVVAPLTSLETVWEYELGRWQSNPPLLAANEGMPKKEREAVIAEAMEGIDANLPFWLIVNPNMVQLEVQTSEDQKVISHIERKMDGEEINIPLVSKFPFIHETKWNNLVIDECHRNAVRNPNTITAKGMYAVKAGKRIGLSGTPMGGKPINLWGILHYLHPKKFSSKWRWAYQWLDVFEEGGYASFGDIRKDRKEAFFKHLQPYILWRTKEDVLPELPPKQQVPIWCRMTPRQKKQYGEFAEKAEVKIREERLSATSILAEYTRLKQFADARQDIRKGQVVPTTDSGKLNALVDKLAELGIMDGEGEAQAVVFSQFEKIVNMVYEYLNEKGVPSYKITGKVRKRGQRAEITRNFQAGKARVCVMQTHTGGLSITLDAADHAFILDETWNPDDQKQATDRIHRMSRIHQVTVYTLRTKGTIEEYIQGVNIKKDANNMEVLKGIRVR